MAVCSHKSCLFSPISVSLAPAASPSEHKPSRYWSELLLQCARDESGAGRSSQSGVANAERQDGEPISRSTGSERAGLRGVCDRRVDEEQRWQLVFDFIVDSTAINFTTV